jgi:hypothetical protein
MSLEIHHWPEGAKICDKCGDIIEACYPYYFDDESGETFCEDCGESM